MNKGINIKLFVTKNVKGFYYVTTSQSNICNDKDFARILRVPVNAYQEILIATFNGKCSDINKEVYFESEKDALYAMCWLYEIIKLKSSILKSYLSMVTFYFISFFIKKVLLID